MNILFLKNTHLWVKQPTTLSFGSFLIKNKVLYQKGFLSAMPSLLHGRKVFAKTRSSKRDIHICSWNFVQAHDILNSRWSQILDFRVQLYASKCSKSDTNNGKISKICRSRNLVLTFFLFRYIRNNFFVAFWERLDFCFHATIIGMLLRRGLNISNVSKESLFLFFNFFLGIATSSVLPCVLEHSMFTN